MCHQHVSYVLLFRLVSPALILASSTCVPFQEPDMHPSRGNLSGQKTALTTDSLTACMQWLWSLGSWQGMRL